MTEEIRMTFHYDVVCPYAYLAAERISRLPEALRMRIDWKPVHLGGLLKATAAETNPMSVMSAHRRPSAPLSVRARKHKRPALKSRLSSAKPSPLLL